MFNKKHRSLTKDGAFCHSLARWTPHSTPSAITVILGDWNTGKHQFIHNIANKYGAHVITADELVTQPAVIPDHLNYASVHAHKRRQGKQEPVAFLVIENVTRDHEKILVKILAEPLRTGVALVLSSDDPDTARHITSSLAHPVNSLFTYRAADIEQAWHVAQYANVHVSAIRKLPDDMMLIRVNGNVAQTIAASNVEKVFIP